MSFLFKKKPPAPANEIMKYAKNPELFKDFASEQSEDNIKY